MTGREFPSRTKERVPVSEELQDGGKLYLGVGLRKWLTFKKKGWREMGRKRKINSM